MIVQSGNPILNKQSATKRSDNRSDANSFEDMLKNAGKKHKPSTKEKASTSSRRKNNDHEVADADVKTRRDDTPVRTKGEKAEARKQTVGKISEDGSNSDKTVGARASGQNKSSLDANGKVESQESSKLSMVIPGTSEEQAVAGGNEDIKNLTGNTNAKDSLVSLNLSGDDKKSLGKNEKLISDFENQINQLSKQKQAGLQMQQAQAAAKAAVAQAPTSKGGALKIDSLKPMESSLESLVAGDQSAAASLDMPKVGGEAADLSDGGAELESMFSQMIDQENSNVEVTGPEFSEELNIGSGSDSKSKVENMQSIIKQARAFVDDGGGTMEIHLQPEGLGKVHLKVAVNNGQVNVEMMADNALGKRALEEGLLDIKTALEGQKLLVETLKVEMSPDYQKDFSDLSNHMQEQENRDFAQQFLGQFRQGREERTGGMFDSFKNFQRNQGEPDLSLSSRNPYTENGKGRTLNLVA